MTRGLKIAVWVGMSNLEDLTGRTFESDVNIALVLGLSHMYRDRFAMWHVEWFCGHVGVVRGSHLKSGAIRDCLNATCRADRARPAFNWTDEMHEVVDGLLLGDGHLNRGSLIFSKSKGRTRGYDQRQWVRAASQTLRQNGIRVKVYQRASRVREVAGRTVHSHPSLKLYTSVYSNFVAETARWYPQGTKAVPKDVRLTPRSLAWWFMADGSTAWWGRDKRAPIKNQVMLQLNTQAFSVSECDMLAARIHSEYGIRFGLGHARGQVFLQCAAIDRVNRFLDLVEPFVHPSCAYKIKRPWYRHRWPKSRS